MSDTTKDQWLDMIDLIVDEWRLCFSKRFLKDEDTDVQRQKAQMVVDVRRLAPAPQHLKKWWREWSADYDLERYPNWGHFTAWLKNKRAEWNEIQSDQQRRKRHQEAMEQLDNATCQKRREAISQKLKKLERQLEVNNDDGDHEPDDSVTDVPKDQIPF